MRERREVKEYFTNNDRGKYSVYYFFMYIQSKDKTKLNGVVEKSVASGNLKKVRRVVSEQQLTSVFGTSVVITFSWVGKVNFQNILIVFNDFF